MQVLEKFKDCELHITLLDNYNCVGIAVKLPNGKRHAVACAPDVTFETAFGALAEWRDVYERQSAT